MVLKREKKFSLWLSSSVAGKDEEEKGEKRGGRGGRGGKRRHTYFSKHRKKKRDGLQREKKL